MLGGLLPGFGDETRDFGPRPGGIDRWVPLGRAPRGQAGHARRAIHDRELVPTRPLPLDQLKSTPPCAARTGTCLRGESPLDRLLQALQHAGRVPSEWPSATRTARWESAEFLPGSCHPVRAFPLRPDVSGPSNVRRWTPLIALHAPGHAWGLMVWNGVPGDGGIDDAVYSRVQHVVAGDLPYRDFLFLHPPGILVLVALFAALSHLSDRQLVLRRCAAFFVAVGVANTFSWRWLLRPGWNCRDRRWGRGSTRCGVPRPLWSANRTSSSPAQPGPPGRPWLLSGWDGLTLRWIVLAARWYSDRPPRSRWGRPRGARAGTGGLLLAMRPARRRRLARAARRRGSSSGLALLRPGALPDVRPGHP